MVGNDAATAVVDEIVGQGPALALVNQVSNTEGLYADVQIVDAVDAVGVVGVADAADAADVDAGTASNDDRWIDHIGTRMVVGRSLMTSDASLGTPSDGM